MAFSGGVFTRLYNWQDDRDNDVLIRADRMDAEFDGIATALSKAILKDGSQTITANIPFGTYKITGLGDPTGAQDAATKNYVDTTALLDSEVTSLSGLKTLTVPDSTTITAAAATILDDATIAAIRTTLDVDQSGTDNSTPVTIAVGLDYITIAGQELTLGSVDLSTDVTGSLPATSLSGTLSDATVAASNVTQHEAALTLSAAQVTAAGALMDSELTDLAGVKALDTSTIVDTSSSQSIGGTKSFTAAITNFAQGVSTGTATIQVGNARTDSGYAILDLVGDVTYTDYGLRVIRGNTGANTFSQIIHKGTGAFSLIADEAATLQFQTDSTNRLTIDGTTGDARFFADLDVDVDLNVDGNIIVPTGTVDGRDISADGALLDTAMQPGDNATDLNGTAWRVFYTNGTGDVTELALGASGTYLGSNGATSAPTFSMPAGSGDVVKVGTPVDGQIGVWTGDGTIEGDTSLTFDTTDDTLVIAASGKLAFGAVDVLSDSAGTTTLQNIDALDATTEATIEAAIDTLSNLTSAASLSITESQISDLGTYVDTTTGQSIGGLKQFTNGTTNFGYQVSTTTAAVQIGHARTDSGYALLELIGDTTYSDFGLRIIRGNTGANSTSQIVHRGTGAFSLINDEQADLSFQTDSLTRVSLDGATGKTDILYDAEVSGNLGVGIAPTHALHVYGNNQEGGLFVEDNNTTASGPSVKVVGKRNDTNTSEAFSGKLLLAHNRTDAQVQIGKSLGTIAFGGNHTDGTLANILYAASITAEADGDFNSSSDMPTRLGFYTSSTGRDPDIANLSFGTERMRIDSAGDVTIYNNLQVDGQIVHDGFATLSDLQNETIINNANAYLAEPNRHGMFRGITTDLSSTLTKSTIASTSISGNIVTVSGGHGLITGAGIATTSTINGITANTVYYAIYLSDTTFSFATTYANAFAGTAVTLTGTAAMTVYELLDPEMGIYIPSPTNIRGASGAWVRQYSGDATVQMFCDDGTTNFGVAISGAICAVGAVYLSDGSYGTTTPINALANCVVKGSGPYSAAITTSSDITLIEQRGDNVDFNNVELYHNGDGLLVDSNQNDGFHLTRTWVRLLDTLSTNHGLDLAGSYNRVTDNTLTNNRTTGYALNLDRRSGVIHIESHIEQNRFGGTGDGVIVQSTDASSRPEGFYFTNNTMFTTGVNLRIEEILEMNLTGNIFDQGGNFNVYIIPTNDGIHGLHFTGNYFSTPNNQTTGIGVEFDNSNSVAARDIGFVNNKFNACGYGARFKDYAYQINFTNNHFTDIEEIGIDFDECGPAICIGNTFRSIDAGGANIRVDDAVGGTAGPFIIDHNHFDSGAAVTVVDSGNGNIQIGPNNTGKKFSGWCSVSTDDSTTPSGNTVNIAHGLSGTPDISKIVVSLIPDSIVLTALEAVEVTAVDGTNITCRPRFTKSSGSTYNISAWVSVY